MLILEQEANKYFKTNLKLKITPQKEESFHFAEGCWFCENPLDDTKVRDHDHLTGKYRGAAHNICNIKVKQKSSSFIHVFFHNFSGYDCHLIFEELLTQAYNLKLAINFIPKSLENYESVKFSDSYRFLSSSLQKRIASLDTFKYMDSEGLTDSLFKKKLAYPYEKFNLENIWIDSLSQPLNLTKADYWSTLT